VPCHLCAALAEGPDAISCSDSDVELCIPVLTWRLVVGRGPLGLPWDLGPFGVSKSPTEDGRRGETPLDGVTRRCARQTPSASSG
jgi:hypothetical protein